MDLASIINQPGAVIVDVREPYEFKSGHARNAINIPLGVLPLRMQELKQTGAPIVVYCRSGARSAQARMLLLSRGFKEVYNGGGLDDMTYYQAKKAA
ncbi:MAG: rhodanese-like domain-containing protein [Lewinellaceae bacterium]|nr:rhodanese-like domain-containing protein [Saprospiraceae bacterium]MCB9316781.1 rhodanese-like domain-containing protein [Lewinellaceae bacterium]MCB9333654.1 rhodanese-like domain-containing protein [Lewinellaceae bacterium]